MRTDVKVGLVCVFAVVLAVVCYFALHDNKTPVLTTSLPTHAAVEGNTGGTGGNVTITPTTSPSAAADSALMTPTLATAGGSLLGPTAAYGQSTPANNGPSFGGTISPPGASTAPSMGGNMPGSLNAPLTPSPGLGSPGATTMGSSLVIPMTPATMNSGETTTGSLLPPISGNTGSIGGTGVGNGHSGTSTGRGTIDLTNPRHSTIDLTTATPGGFGEPGLIGSTSADASGTYTIVKGDTFGSLAKKNGVTIKAIQAANPGVNSNHLKIGQKIKMPSATSSASSSGSAATSRPASSNRSATTKKSSTSSGAKAVAGGTYTVKKGDTLRKIAKAVYGDESLWQRIFRANRGEMSDANDLTVGQVIKLPATK